MEHTFQAYDFLSIRLARLLKQSHQFWPAFLRDSARLFIRYIPPKRADKINHNHNCQENEIIDKNADDSLAHI